MDGWLLINILGIVQLIILIRYFLRNIIHFYQFIDSVIGVFLFKPNKRKLLHVSIDNFKMITTSHTSRGQTVKVTPVTN